MIEECITAHTVIMNMKMPSNTMWLSCCWLIPKLPGYQSDACHLNASLVLE
jgi:hypothetical protein